MSGRVDEPSNLRYDPVEHQSFEQWLAAEYMIGKKPHILPDEEFVSVWEYVWGSQEGIYHKKMREHLLPRDPAWRARIRMRRYRATFVHNVDEDAPQWRARAADLAQAIKQAEDARDGERVLFMRSDSSGATAGGTEEVQVLPVSAVGAAIHRVHVGKSHPGEKATFKAVRHGLPQAAILRLFLRLFLVTVLYSWSCVVSHAIEHRHMYTALPLL